MIDDRVNAAEISYGDEPKEERQYHIIVMRGYIVDNVQLCINRRPVRIRLKTTCFVPYSKFIHSFGKEGNEVKYSELQIHCSGKKNVVN